MNMTAQVQPKPTATTSSTPVRTSLLHRKCACGGTPGLNGECAECRRKRLQRSPVRAAPATVPPVVNEVLRSPGQPLGADTRAFMEPRFGHDFSKVRVHTDARAAESTRAVNALAYTVGRDVVFGAGQYAPATTSGRQLLAHELTHVAQQGPVVRAPLAIGAPASPAEREAEQAAARVTQGGWGAVSAGAEPATLQRQEAEEDEFRLRLPELGQGLGFRPPRIGLDLPQLQLDPEITMQIRAIQFARGLLSIENIMAAAEEIDGGVGPAPPGTPATAPGLALSPGQLQGGSPALAPGGSPAGGLGQPLPARPPLVPRGKGPETPRAGKVGDLIGAVLKVPAVQAGIDRLRMQAESELRADWKGLSGGERVLVITQGVVLGAGIVAGVASDPEASQFVLGLVQGQNIPIPRLPMTFQFNLTGLDQRLVIGLDVGALLPAGSGFGPRKKAK